MLKWILLFSLVTATAVDAQQPPKIAVFVGPQIRDGFVDVDAGTVESIADIQNEFQRSKQFSIARAPEEAIIILLVVGRRFSGSAGAIEIAGMTYGGGTIGGVRQPTFTTPGIAIPIDRHAIDTLLRVRNYEKPITSEDPNGGIWKTAAKQVVKDVTAWADANRTALLPPKP